MSLLNYISGFYKLEQKPHMDKKENEEKELISNNHVSKKPSFDKIVYNEGSHARISSYFNERDFKNAKESMEKDFVLSCIDTKERQSIIKDEGKVSHI
jgi:hypothetical protein